jgi:hypothetical protein
VPGIPLRPRRKSEPWLVGALRGVMPGLVFVVFLALGGLLAMAVSELTGSDLAAGAVVTLSLVVAVILMERVAAVVMSFLE